MATEILVTDHLSESMIAVGKTLIERIKNDIDLKAVYWIFAFEIREWRLVIVSEDFRKYGPRKMYERVLKANESADEKEKILSILNVSISSDLEKKVDRIFATPPPKKDTYIDGVYMYSKDCVKADDGSKIYNQTH